MNANTKETQLKEINDIRKQLEAGKFMLGNNIVKTGWSDEFYIAKNPTRCQYDSASSMVRLTKEDLETLSHLQVMLSSADEARACNSQAIFSLGEFKSATKGEAVVSASGTIEG